MSEGYKSFYKGSDYMKHYFPALKLISNQWLMSLNAGWVIAKRLQMMNQAALGVIPWNHAEFSKLWPEKLAAANEAAWIAHTYWFKSAFTIPDKALYHQMSENLKFYNDVGKPYQRRVKANHKRLYS